MSAETSVFKRFEKKYILSRTQYDELMVRLDGRVRPDGFGRHTISNIYFDTDRFDLIRRSVEKPLYKEKLRIRSYEVPRPDDDVFIELKKKFKGEVYKRRVRMTLSEANTYLLRHKAPVRPCQITREIDWFMALYRPVPKVFIGYERFALLGLEDPGLRITIDRALRFRESLLDLSRGSWGRPLLPEGQLLMEVKLPGAMPLWLCDALSVLAIYPASYSKYGAYYTQTLTSQLDLKGGIISA